MILGNGTGRSREDGGQPCAATALSRRRPIDNLREDRPDEAPMSTRPPPSNFRNVGLNLCK